MFSFLPQLLIILSIVGIIIVVLRKVPPITDFVRRTPWRKVPIAGLTVAARKIKDLVLAVLRKLWHYVLEVKEISKGRSFPRLPKFQMPKIPKIAGRKGVSGGDLLNEAEKKLISENYEEAEADFIKVLKLDPKNEEAYAGLGKIYLTLQKFDEAAETFKYLVKHHPENDSYFANLGLAHHGRKSYQEAIAAYEQAIELSPDKAKRYLNLGLSLEAVGHLEEAILNYRKAADLEKTNIAYLLSLAEALAKKGEKEEAEKTLEEILQLEPTNEQAREKLMKLKF